MGIRIKSFDIENFKGIKKLSTSPNGKNYSIYGANLGGKSTCFDAFLWSMFDRDSRNQSRFPITPTSDDTAKTSVKHCLLVDGNEINIEKRYCKKVSKKTGTKNVTEYFWNEKPVSKTEFSKNIAGIIGEENFRLLSDPLYFNEQLHWQKQRTILFDLFPSITDEEIISQNGDLADLPNILNGNTIADHKAICKSKKSVVDGQLKSIPSEIKGIQSTITETTETIPDLKAQLTCLEVEKIEKEKELFGMQNGEELSKKRKELSSLEQKISKFETDLENSKRENLKGLNSKFQEVSNLIAENDKNKKEKQSLINDANRSITQLETFNKEAREEFHKIEAEVFDGVKCDKCGQDLPKAQFIELRNEFNLKQSQRLEEINDEGLKNVSRIEKLKKEIAEHERWIKELKDGMEILEERLSIIQAGIDAINNGEANNPEIEKLKKEKTRLEKIISGLEKFDRDDIELIESDIAVITTKIQSVNSKIAAVENNEKNKEAVKKLGESQKIIAADQERLEYHLNLIKLFDETRSKYLSDRINAKFKVVNFKLFHRQENGEEVQCCEAMHGLNPYSVCSTSERTNMGLDIINVLQEQFGCKTPIFIDNRESITKIPEMGCQIINLYVSPEDEALRIEVEE